jgi:uncharacterized membrane protein (DUF485 family)
MALFQPSRGSASGTEGTQSTRSATPPTWGATQPTRSRPNGYEAVRASRDFWTIQRRFGSFVGPACALLLFWYFLFVIVAVFAPGFMRISVFGAVNVGLCFGVLQFVSTFALALGYRRWARRRLDPLTDRLRRRLEGGRY